MANWCINSLEVTGDEVKVEEFTKKFMDGGVNAFIPTPKELEDTEAPAQYKDPEKAKENIEKYGAADWYDWRVKNWGTKWDVGELCLTDRSEGYAYFTFETAWSPIVEAISKIAKMYPELTFSLDYEESGMGFFGKAIFRDGELSSEWEYDWEDRFGDGWWLYKELEDVYEIADSDLNNMLFEKQITEEEYNKVSELMDSLSEHELLRMLAIIDKQDAEGLKSFLEDYEEED